MAFNNADGTCGGHLLRGAATVVFLVIFFALPVLADYEAGRKAWDAGRKSEALAQWRAAANEGDAKAMAALGQLYLQGVGVLQDFVEAHMWFNLAASRGVAEAAKERDAVAAKMTPQQIATAQERARSLRPGMAEGGGRGAQTGSAAGSPPPRAIREAQELLGKLGYDAGPADGVWGGRSARAYGSFLRDAGMARSETLTPEGLRALRAAAAGGAPADPKPRQPVSPAAPVMPPDALHRAVAAGDVNGVNEVLKAGVDVNSRDGGGWTALMHAAAKGYKLMVGPLLEARANPDVEAADGATALFMAAAGGHTEIVVLLMRAGADITIKGPQDRTAADVARLRWGEASAAREQGAHAALVALLEGRMYAGRTWAEVEAERQWQEFNERMVARLKKLKRIKDCDVCPEMVVIPAGEFMMGSPEGEKGRHDNEGPRHKVKIREAFAVGKYEVTFEEWNACVSGGGCEGHRPGDEGWGRGRRPVIYVSWEDAKAYVAWLSEKTGKYYRLLTEAEWEYAARAGTDTRYYWGDEAGRVTKCVGCDADDRETRPVGSFGPNGFGLYDVHGNVHEWVEDCWPGNYAGAPTDGSAWVTGGDCELRVLRGGSWNNLPGNLRSASRDWFRTGNRRNDTGFRVARSLLQTWTEVKAERRAERRRREEKERQILAELQRRWPEGESFRECRGCPEMVVIPAGDFMMGSPAGEEERYNDEGSQHRVRIGRPIAVGKYEVTRSEYERFVKESGRQAPARCWTYEAGEVKERLGRDWSNPGFSQGGREPVVCVSWEDAQAYVAWLSAKTGKSYRLLTEAEWEYMARAGTATARYWGEGESGQCGNANGADMTAKRHESGWTVASCEDGYYRTAPVGSFGANGFGLHDVMGNVWEWVEDCWHKNYSGAPTDGSAWMSGGNCGRRVLRGGSWLDVPRRLRSARRDRNGVGARYIAFGFRVARTLAQ